MRKHIKGMFTGYKNRAVKNGFKVLKILCFGS